MKVDIPIVFSVSSTNQLSAENTLADFLRQAMREFGNEYSIVDFEFSGDFDRERCLLGCGNDYKKQRESI